MRSVPRFDQGGWLNLVGRFLSILPQAFSGTIQQAWRRVVRNTSLLLVGAIAVAVLAFVAAGMSCLNKTDSNRTTAALLSGKNLKVDLFSADENVLQARAYFHLYRDDLESAQPIVDAARTRASPGTKATMFYNMANARLRRAIKLVERGNHDKAIALVRLAKDEYRESLTINPDNWNAKYNLDLAMRLVRDFPGGTAEDEEAEQDAPKKIWTDLPGVPRGLP